MGSSVVGAINKYIINIAIKLIHTLKIKTIDKVSQGINNGGLAGGLAGKKRLS